MHRLGVDLYCEDDDGEIWRVRQGVQAQPGRTNLLTRLLLRDDDDDVYYCIGERLKLEGEDGTVSTRLETFG